MSSINIKLQTCEDYLKIINAKLDQAQETLDIMRNITDNLIEEVSALAKNEEWLTEQEQKKGGARV